MMYEIEFLKVETSEKVVEQLSTLDWREAASYAYKMQHTLREKRGGNWKFLRLELVG